MKPRTNKLVAQTPTLRRLTDAELDELAEPTEDWCPDWDTWHSVLAMAREANRRERMERG